MAIEPVKLSSEDQRTLEQLGPDITDLEAEIARAERAGIDVSELKAKLANTKKLRNGILREYGS